MNILLAVPEGEIRRIYFPEEAMKRLRSLGNLQTNDSGAPFSPEELSRQLRGVDVCVTHWGTPKFDETVLEGADKLRLIAHAAGSVADLVSEAAYERGIRVCSANTIMARHVAEGVLAYILAGLRDLPRCARSMREGAWDRDIAAISSLFGKKVGLIGLGTVGRFLVELLKPFGVELRVYDPYLSAEAIAALGNARAASLDVALAWGDVISVHASLTPETRHLLGKEKLSKIRDGALFVNTARGAVVDEAALLEELKTGRFRAVLDVFEQEPLPAESGLRNLPNATLMPHVVGSSAREDMTFGVIEEIGRFLRGEPLQYEIPYEKFRLMTKERQ
jgi:phosphoglycerate dehydrogenase-like enzyme